MYVEIVKHEDNWQEAKDRAMNTVGAEEGKYPSSSWKRKILKAEHSPIRVVDMTVRIHDIPYWVAMHLVRHKVGVEHWISTQRSDRTGVYREELPQGALVNHSLKLNAQSLINISRRRLCSQASPETRAAWKAVIEAVREVEPELADLCVPECIYRGHCPEMKPCGYADTEDYEKRKTAYQSREIPS